MAACKFCGVAEGALDRRGAATHINRDGLCTYCYRLLPAVRKDPSSVEPSELAWYRSTCKHNIVNGLFVPAVERRKAAGWMCKKCGAARNRDDNYTNYCIGCADTIRRSREMPDKSKRKERSDKEKTHEFGKTTFIIR